MKDYPVLYTAIREDLDVQFSGDKDFSDVNVERPEILTPAQFRPLCRGQIIRLPILNRRNVHTQWLYFRQLAQIAGYKLNFSVVDSDCMMIAMIHADSMLKRHCTVYNKIVIPSRSLLQSRPLRIDRSGLDYNIPLWICRSSGKPPNSHLRLRLV